MKIIIDDDVCKRYGYNTVDILLLAAIKIKHEIREHLVQMEKLGIIVEKDDKYYFCNEEIKKEFQKVLLESEPEIPKTNELMEFVGELRALFPKGIKTGSVMWRGNIRDITTRLQKFFKLYGTKYSFEEIYEATKKYVESFNGDYKFMKTLGYFILKDDVSELATFLENDCVREEEDDFLLELR